MLSVAAQWIATAIGLKEMRISERLQDVGGACCAIVMALSRLSPPTMLMPSDTRQVKGNLVSEEQVVCHQSPCEC